MNILPRWLPLAAGFTVLAILGGGGWFYHTQRQYLRQDAEEDLQTIAQLKVYQVVQWRAEGLNQAWVLMQDPFFGEAVARWMADPEAGGADTLRAHFRSLQTHYHYSDVELVDASGKARLSLSGKPGPLPAEGAEALAASFRGHRAVLTLLGPTTDLPAPNLVGVAPFFTRNGPASTPLGAVFLWTDAGQFLYPVIQTWPRPSASAETLLVRRDGDSVLYLNELRHQTQTALPRRIPLSQTNNPAVMAVLGREGVFEGTDYRGVQVLSVLEAVPGSRWHLVAKVDTAEALVRWRFQSTVILGLMFGLMLVSVAGFGFLWQRNEKAHYRSLYLRETTLRQSQEDYRSLFENMAEGFAHCRMVFEDGQPQDFIYLAVNPAFEKLTGLRDAVGRKVSELIPGLRQSDPGLFETYGRVSLSGQPERFEAFVAALNDWFSISVYSPEKDQFVAVFDVITERKQAEAALRKSQDDLQEAQRVAHMGSWSLDIRTDTVVWSDEIYRIFGLAKPEFRGTHEAFMRCVHAEDRPRVLQAGAKARADGEPFDIEYRIVTPGGELKVIQEIAASIRDDAGRVVGLIGTAQDITERKQAEAALRLSEEQSRAMFEMASIGIAQADPGTGQWLRVNPKMCEITGYSAAELLRMRIGDLTHAEDRQPDWEAFQRVVRGEAPNYRLEKRYVRKDGSAAWVNINMTVLRDAAGQPTRTMATIEDISERKRAEEQLRRQANLLDLARDAILVCDMEGHIYYWNRGAESLYGWTAAEVKGRPTGDLQAVTSENPAVDRERFLATGEWTGELQQLTREGRQVIVSSRWTLVRDAEGRPESVLIINTDVTEKKQLEAKFLRAQRLESIGSLASGIAHDLNNILSPIMMCAPLLRAELSNEEREQMLSIVEASARRAVGIVKQLLSFGRGQAGQKAALQVRYLLREVCKIVRETFPRSIQVEEDLAADLWLVTGDATQLHQVLLNLCVNARDAMPSGGKLSVHAENVLLDESSASRHKDVSAGPFVRIQVQDTGTGIPESARDHIFDSFFTTKSADQGTGVGLTTALGIVKNHHGFITFTTAEARGTTFEIHLPATPEVPASARPEQVDTPVPRGQGELILLVDDEPSILTAARRTLERHGYAVLQAQDGIEALAQFTSRQNEISAVVTDFMMPEMDGVMLCRALRRLSPRTPLIISSGGLSGKDAANTLLAFSALGVHHILQKPHDAEVLVQALHEVLNPTAQERREGAA